ncbi:hypothetical protein EOI86_22635 [Hwanghaeella grinnelliae]|uniref:Uncharacterized protein n=1 Tax=Hwanghaeella grinnelliae TaxID=2500179 RepID=A0A3S2W272_9PROT|nr:hypothetical protein [Hwanghaeella grinnelliae]RVU33928.1 hypothetical protein EOI86_22635 [Hwanghaeella grinnelliae]
MGEHHVLCLGGTGAKFGEALIHLTACGLSKGSLKIHIIDQDLNNKNVNALRTLAESASGAKRIFPNSGKENFPYFRTDIQVGPPYALIKHGQVQFKDIYTNSDGINNIKSFPSDIILRSLFSKKSQEQELAIGFNASAQIGAAVFDQELNLNANGLGKHLSDILRQADQSRNGSDDRVSVTLLGSAFGGTGSSGLPMISQFIRDYIRDESLRIRLNAVVATNYFRISDVNTEFGPRGAYSTSLGLRHLMYLDGWYRQTKQCCLWDSLYLVGQSREAGFPPDGSGGGPDQHNIPHGVELIGGLAACAASLEDEDPDVTNETLRLALHEHSDRIEWDDIPNVSDDLDTATAIQTFAMWLVLIQRLIFPMLQAQEDGVQANYAPLNRHFRGRDFDQSEVQAVSTYADRFFSWIVSMEKSHNEWMSSDEPSIGNGLRWSLLGLHRFFRPTGTLLNQVSVEKEMLRSTVTKDNDGAFDDCFVRWQKDLLSIKDSASADKLSLAIRMLQRDDNSNVMLDVLAKLGTLPPVAREHRRGVNSLGIKLWQAIQRRT